MIQRFAVLNLICRRNFRSDAENHVTRIEKTSEKRGADQAPRSASLKTALRTSDYWLPLPPGPPVPVVPRPVPFVFMLPVELFFNKPG